MNRVKIPSLDDGAPWLPDAVLALVVGLVGISRGVERRFLRSAGRGWHSCCPGRVAPPCSDCSPEQR